MGLYFLLQVGVLGSIPLAQLKDAKSVASSVLEQVWGSGAAKSITVLIVIAAIGSVFAGLLGGSRVPFEAARDKVFLPVFGKLHPKLHLPTAGVLTMGVITILGSLFTLTTVINAAVATLVIIQSLAQVAAIVVLRRRQPGLRRPYRQWLYPVPTHHRAGRLGLHLHLGRLALDRAVAGLDRRGRARVPGLRQGREHVAVRAQGDQRGVRRHRHRRGTGMTKKLAALAALLLVPGVLSVAGPAAAQDAQAEVAKPHGLSTIGLQGWQVRTTADVKDGGDQVSTPGYATRGWLPVKPDDAGAPGTEINALVQNGKCPDVFYSDNMRKCFGYVDKVGPVATLPFSDPWWYRTDFTPDIKAGQHAKLTIPGIVGEGDVWVNGKLVATKDIVSGAFAGHTFDVSQLVKPGKNTLAIKVYPNNPLKMYTLDQVDWSQIPPDNDTGIQFPPTLQVGDALTGDNAHVVQDNAADLSSSKLTVKLDVTNNAATPQTGDVAATVTPPSGAPVVVHQRGDDPGEHQADRDVRAGEDRSSRRCGGRTRWATSRCTR